MSGYRVGRTDGAFIQDGLVAGNLSYFFWYAFVPRLDRGACSSRRVSPPPFQQPRTGVHRQHRHRTMSRGTPPSPLRVTINTFLTRDVTLALPSDSMVVGGRRLPSGDGSDGRLPADSEPADVARSERGQERVRDYRVRRAVGRAAPPFEHASSMSLWQVRIRVSCAGCAFFQISGRGRGLGRVDLIVARGWTCGVLGRLLVHGHQGDTIMIRPRGPSTPSHISSFAL